MKMRWWPRVAAIVKWPTLAFGATAISASNSAAAATTSDAAWDAVRFPDGATVLPNTLNSTATDRYAAHRSHSSHRSHGSHRSSSGGGYSTTPRTPTPSPPPPTYSPPPPPVYSPPSPPPPSSTYTPSAPKQPVPKAAPIDTSMMVVRVQAALMRLEIYDGDIDGILGPKTREALMQYQKAQGLKQSGRMDIETLTKLGIPIP